MVHKIDVFIQTDSVGNLSAAQELALLPEVERVFALSTGVGEEDETISTITVDDFSSAKRSAALQKPHRRSTWRYFSSLPVSVRPIVACNACAMC